MVGALFCPSCQILTVWFHYTVFPRLCCFRLTTLSENCHSDTLYNISRHKFAIVILTHWGRVTHICVDKLTIIGSDNGLSPGRRQAIIWTSAGILLIRTLGTNFSEILGEIHSFSFSKIHLKMSSAKWRLFGLGLNELKWHVWNQFYDPLYSATLSMFHGPVGVWVIEQRVQ